MNTSRPTGNAKHESPNSNGNICKSSIGLGSSDEDSFVVLDRSPSQETIGRPTTSFIGNDYLATQMTNNSSTDEGLFSTNNMLFFKGQPMSNFSSGLSMDISPEEIQTKINDVLRENINLKETLYQNNLGMKQQLNTLRVWQEEVNRSHRNHKEKFAETKDLIFKLRAENEELKSSLKVLQESKSEPSASEVSLQASNIALTSQVNALQGQVAALNLRNNHIMMNTSSSKKEQELISLTEQLNRQLEIVERSKRQMSMDIEKLQAQKSRLERDIVILNVDLESQKQKAESLEKKYKTLEQQPFTSGVHQGEVDALRIQLKEHQDVIEKLTSHQLEQVEKATLIPSLTGDLKQNLTIHEQKLGDINCDLQKQTERYSSLGSWLNVAAENVNTWDKNGTGDFEKANKFQFEIDEVKKLLAQEQTQGQEKAKMLSEAQQQFQNLFSDYQSVLQDLEDLNKKPSENIMERQSISYYEVQVRGFIEKIDNMTAQMMNLQDALTQKSQQVVELTEKNRLLVSENESIPVLQIQMQVYQADFNAEREARESLAGEKERLSEDLRHLQRRNQQLLNELKLYQQKNYTEQTNIGSGWNTISNPGRNHARENTPPSPGPHDL